MATMATSALLASATAFATGALSARVAGGGGTGGADAPRDACDDGFAVHQGQSVLCWVATATIVLLHERCQELLEASAEPVTIAVGGQAVTVALHKWFRAFRKRSLEPDAFTRCTMRSRFPHEALRAYEALYTLMWPGEGPRFDGELAPAATGGEGAIAVATVLACAQPRGVVVLRRDLGAAFAPLVIPLTEGGADTRGVTVHGALPALAARTVVVELSAFYADRDGVDKNLLTAECRTGLTGEAAAAHDDLLAHALFGPPGAAGDAVNFAYVVSLDQINADATGHANYSHQVAMFTCGAAGRPTLDSVKVCNPMATHDRGKCWPTVRVWLQGRVRAGKAARRKRGGRAHVLAIAKVDRIGFAGGEVAPRPAKRRMLAHEPTEAAGA